MLGPVVALDADVLVPIVACDFLLTAFELGLYEPVVSETVFAEVERALLSDHPHLSADAVSYRVSAMRDALEDQLVDATVVQVPATVNPKDRHVVGAALLGEATILTSNDSKLRQEIAEALSTLVPLSLDEFATSLWRQSPDDVSAVVDHLVAKRSKPPVTREAMLKALEVHLPATIHRLEQSSPK